MCNVILTQSSPSHSTKVCVASLPRQYATSAQTSAGCPPLSIVSATPFSKKIWTSSFRPSPLCSLRIQTSSTMWGKRTRNMVEWTEQMEQSCSRRCYRDRRRVRREVLQRRRRGRQPIDLRLLATGSTSKREGNMMGKTCTVCSVITSPCT